MLFFIALLVFASVAIGAREMLRPRSDTIERRIGVGKPSPATRETRLQGSMWRRMALPGVRQFGRAVRELLPQSFVRRIEHMLTMANEPWSLTGFLIAWGLSAGLGAALWV